MSTSVEKKNTLGGVATLLLAVGVGVSMVSCKEEAAAPAPEKAADKPAAVETTAPAPAVEEPAVVEPAPAVEEPAVVEPAPAVEEPVPTPEEDNTVEVPASAVEEEPTVDEPVLVAGDNDPFMEALMEEQGVPVVDAAKAEAEKLAAEAAAAEAAAKAEAEKLAAEAAAAEAAAKAEAERIAAERKATVNSYLDRVNSAAPKAATGQLYQKRLQTLLPMIADGQNVNVTTEETKGNTALHYACATGDVELVKWLIDNGADVNAKTEAGKTPIECIGGDKEAADALYLLLKGIPAPVNE
ncbi:MAG: ankyrin repeat domain-containing protein [Akkermansia sp.]|nr:ankyrin repeat domain-containing protein [Akkermansia sp.]